MQAFGEPGFRLVNHGLAVASEDGSQHLRDDSEQDEDDEEHQQVLRRGLPLPAPDC